MQETRLVEDVMQRMGTHREAEARTALHATLSTLGEHLPAADAEAIAAELPADFAALLRGAIPDTFLGLDAFQARVARRSGVSSSFAREHAQAVCAALDDLLAPATRARLRGGVWPELLRPSLRDRFGPTMPATGRSLAEGRPGSRHPLSEAHPIRKNTLAESRPGSLRPLSEVRADRTQSGSVASGENPHGDRKLSSAH
jgi:uncharacterized protein (DUF2267 family)